MSLSTGALAVKRSSNSTPWCPCHYGSFPIIEASDKFVAEMKVTSPKVIVPRKGKPLRRNSLRQM